MEQMSLFDDRRCSSPPGQPASAGDLREFVGQKHLLGQGKILRQLIEQDQVSSMIFWGPPGGENHHRKSNRGEDKGRFY